MMEKEEIRECKILAGMLQPIETFYPEIADIWVENIRNIEIAELTCMNLFQHLPYAHPVETVENLMVTVAAAPVVTVYESVVYIAAWNELRHDTGICGKYGTQPFKLGLLFPIYPDLIAFFKTLPYVFRKQFEILVEDGLRRNIEFYRLHVLH